MTVQNPALYLQGANHPAEDFRHLISSIYGEQPGVLGAGHLAVSEKSGTPNMSVDVAEGTVLVAGDEASYQGLYLCQNRGVTNLVISAADVTNDRYDLVVAQVEDSDYSGATDAWKLAIVTGTPAATPLFPTVPDNSFVLATVLVQASVSSIVDADITDIRSGSDSDGTTTLINYGLAPMAGTIRCTSTNRPASPWDGMKIYETDTLRELTYFSTEWKITAAPWQDYTVTFSPGLTSIGNGTLYGRYQWVGDTVHFSIFLDVGSTTTFSGADFAFSLPKDVADGNTRFSCYGYARDGTFRYAANGVVVENGTTVSAIGADGGAFDSTTPFTWTTQDYLVLTGTYETDAVVS